MYDGNPGKIDFGLSYRKVRVSEGSSYRESTVYAGMALQHGTTTNITFLPRLGFSQKGVQPSYGRPFLEEIQGKFTQSLIVLLDGQFSMSG